MRYVSLFSGVEAATVAWSRLGWEPLAFAEIDEFPAAVLAARFPHVPNLGDVRDIDWKEFYEKHGAVDVLVGGSPCQSFSIAGSRAGLDGESRLMFEYIRAVRDLVRVSGGSPRYILWENVPGCLSSNKGRDFGRLLDELEDCGYFVAWRTLDSQFTRVFRRECGRQFGPVPQRRRRVFLVGSLGGPSACDILFERTSLRGDYPKGREAKEALARSAEGCVGMGDSAGFKYHHGGGANVICMQDGQSDGTVTEDGTATTLNASHEQPIVCARDWRGAGNEYVSEGERYVVRRLMPVECERLQAFPDGWTDITGCDVDAVTERVAKALKYEPGSEKYKTLLKKVQKWSEQTPDTPRYKAMGNSMTTYVIEILGRRIQAYDELHYDEIRAGCTSATR